MNTLNNKPQEFAAEVHRARRNLALSLLLSVGIAWASVFWTWQIGQQANSIDHALFHAREGVGDLQRYAEQTRGNKR